MRERKFAHSPNWSVRCVSAPGPDTDLTLHVMFDSERYLIGCGEGTQRAMAQKQRQLKGIQAVLLPNAQAKTRAGLAGMIMTLADAGLSKLNIIGTSDTAHYLATMRSCVVRDKFPVHAISHPLNSSPDEPVILHETPCITISAIALVPPSTRPISASSASSHAVNAQASNSYATPDIAPDMHTNRPSTLDRPTLELWRNMAARGILGKPFGRPLPPAPAPAPIASSSTSASTSTADPPPIAAESAAHDPSEPALLANTAPLPHFDGVLYPSWPEQRFPLPLPTEAEQAMDMVYFFQAPDVRGKFDAKRADELGVPKKQRGVLTQGGTVEVDVPGQEGKRVVRPEDCLIGGGPGPALIVVTCSLANLDGLLASTAFHRYQPDRQDSSAGAISPHVVVHRVEQAIWTDPAYQAWMKAFGSTTQHLLADPTRAGDSIYFRNSAWNAAQLSVLDPTIFHQQLPDSASSSTSPTSPADVVASYITPYTEVRMYPRGEAIELKPHAAKDEPIPSDQDQARQDSLVWIKKAGNDETARGVKDRAAFDLAVAQAREAIGADPAASAPYDGPGADLRITTLGTGSAIPSKYRNVSSTLLECPAMTSDGEPGVILLDCGEGTLGQMRRLYGMEGIKRVYRELRMVFVSHMHADHHLGLQAILEDRFRNGLTAPLYILAPPQIALSLQENASWQSRDIASDEALQNVHFLNSARFLRSRVTLPVPDEELPFPRHATGTDSTGQEIVSGSEAEDADSYIFTSRHRRAPRHLKGLLPLAPPREWGQEDLEKGTRRWPVHDVLGWSPEINLRQHNASQNLLLYLNLSSIQCVQVPHRGYATALILDHPSGWRVVYSGDAKPSDKLARLGKGATVLIHEATMQDEFAEMADAKGHSTFGQAIEIGRKMGAKHVLLNHFSQRYPKLPENINLSGGPSRSAVPDTQVAGNEATPAQSASPGTEQQTPTVEELSINPIATPTAESHISSSAPISDAFAEPTMSATDPATSLRHPVVAMSFDFMSVSVRDMYKIAHYLEAIAEIYKDGEDGDSATVDGVDGVAVNGGGGGGAGKGRVDEQSAEEAALNGSADTTAKSQGQGQQQTKQGKQPKQKQHKQPKQPKPQRDTQKQSGDGNGNGPMNGTASQADTERIAKRASEDGALEGGSPDRKRPREETSDVPRVPVKENQLAPEQADL